MFIGFDLNAGHNAPSRGLVSRRQLSQTIATLSRRPVCLQAVEQLVKMGVRAEQQALARWGLNYVIDEYLPRKLKQTAKFLP